MPSNASAAMMQRGCDRPADEGFGDVHFAASAVPGAPTAAMPADDADPRIDLQLVLPVCHHAVALGTPFSIDGQVARCRAGFDRVRLGDVVGIHDPDEQAMLAALDRRRRHRDDVVGGFPAARGH